MNSLIRSQLVLGLAALAGCAAQPGDRPAFEGTKTEALVGARCTDDSGCEAHEFCNRIYCITTPCPDLGTCQDQTRFYDNESVDIPDNDSNGVLRQILIDRPASTVTSAHVSVHIDHSWRGDLRVVLTSPDGTELVLHDRTGGSADDLDLGLDVTDTFDGENAVGAWTLQVSDHAAQDVGRLLTWHLELTFGTPVVEPEPVDAVWAEVSLPLESEHDYQNDIDQSWDLRLYSAGASRARIRFSRIDLEEGYDVLEVVDLDTGVVLDRFTGHYDAFTTHDYETGNLGLRFATDYSVVAWGFAIEAIEVFGLGCLEDDDCGAGYQCPTELVRCARYPCFVSCVPDDAPPAAEGEACGATDDCVEGLYCATDGLCHAAGTCAAVDDCSDPNNPWVHILCAGYATCGAGMCGWQCGVEPPACVEGETMYDGCNHCSCSDGNWLCTRRACLPEAGLGEACGFGTICEEGLVCDQGRSEASTCMSDGPGTCQHEGLVYCRQLSAPVCTCNGQTFDNECSRVGSAPYAHDGACEFDVAIPDADAAGITHSIEVLTPAAATTALVTVRIDHSWRGDLVVWVEAPDGTRHTLTNREGGSADDFEYNQEISLGTASAVGTWTLHVADLATADVGVLRFFNVLGR